MSMAYHMGYAHTHALYANYQMPSYMDSLDLSDILDFEDYMVTSSNEDIPAFEDTRYWETLWFDLNIT